jgi:hypothetical protein
MTALSVVYTDDACVDILQGCPMMVWGNSDCVPNDPVDVYIGVHTAIPDVTEIQLSIVYPEFISPPLTLAGNVFGSLAPLITGTIGPASSLPVATFAGVSYYSVPIHIFYSSPVTIVPGPYYFAGIHFTYTNVPPRPTGQNTFLCWATSPVGGLNHTDVYTLGSPTVPLTPLTQSNHVYFTGCSDAPFINAAFTLDEVLCTGEVRVTGLYSSPSAIHIWHWGDNRSTPLNGAQTATWNYYAPYTDNFSGTQPGVPQGTYTITHTVIDNNVFATQTMNVTLYAPCCTTNTSLNIADGTSASSIGPFVTGMDVDVQGDFIIDQTFAFISCNVKMEPGSKITVRSPYTFRIDGSILDACSNMWKGIFIDGGANCTATMSSINDAQFAMYAHDRATIGAWMTTFDRNYVSIEVPQNINPPYYNVIGHWIEDCDFTCTSNLLQPFINQTPAPGTISFAAVEGNTVAMDFYNAGSPPNNFIGLSNGIVGQGMDMRVENCYFENIQPDAAYNFWAFNGSAVYDRGYGHFNTINQVGFGQSTNSFLNCKYGVFGDAVNVSSTDNKMTQMNHSHEIRFGSYMNIDVLRNWIESYATAIDLYLNDNSNHLLVEDNTVYFGDMTGNGYTGINVREQLGTNPDSKIRNNDIFFNTNATSAYIGILVSSAHNYQITYNNLLMDNNANNFCGIYTLGCKIPEVSCNSVTGSFSNYTNSRQAAILNFMGSSPNITCNTVDGTFNGIVFLGPAYGTDVKGNNINTHVNGLHLYSSAIIGQQDWKGNLWYQTPLPGGWGARYDDLLNASIFPFKVNPATILGGTTMPPSVNPAGWFIPLTGTNFLCDDNGDNYCDQFSHQMCPDCKGSLDDAIATSNLENSPFTEETQWTLKMDLYKKLNDNPDMLNDDQVLSDFYNEMQNELISQFSQINEEQFNLFGLDNTVRTNLNENKTALQQNMDLLKQLSQQLLDDSQGPLSQSEINTIQSTIAGVRQTILDIVSYNKTALDLAANTRTLTAENIESVNSGLVTSETIEANEKAVNNIYLNTIAKGVYEFNSSQQNELYSIAIQCPISGGNSVFRARDLYSMVNNSVSYDDFALCLMSGILMREAGNVISIPEPYMYPNPAGESATLIYSLPENTTGELLIYNTLGQIESRYSLTDKTTQFKFSTSTLNSGVFYYKVYNDGELISTGKLSIVR